MKKRNLNVMCFKKKNQEQNIFTIWWVVHFRWIATDLMIFVCHSILNLYLDICIYIFYLRMIVSVFELINQIEWTDEYMVKSMISSNNDLLKFKMVKSWFLKVKDRVKDNDDETKLRKKFAIVYKITLMRTYIGWWYKYANENYCCRPIK